MYTYKAKDLETCLRTRDVVYIGDSTIRQIFWATARKLDLKRASNDIRSAEKHMDLSFESHGISIQFIWDPYLNSTRLHNQLSSASSPITHVSGSAKAAIFLVGGGLWHAKHLNSASFQHFNHSIQHIGNFVTPDQNAPLQTKDSLMILAPIQIPLYESLDPQRAEFMDATRVNPMNEHLLQLSTAGALPIAWAFSLMTWNQKAAYDLTGLHASEDVSERMADVLLNMRCNGVLLQSKGYPMDKTCCTGYPKPNGIQYLILTCSLGLVPCLLLVVMKGNRSCTKVIDLADICTRCPKSRLPPFTEDYKRLRCISDDSLLLLLRRPDTAVEQGPETIRCNGFCDTLFD